MCDFFTNNIYRHESWFGLNDTQEFLFLQTLDILINTGTLRKVNIAMSKQAENFSVSNSPHPQSPIFGVQSVYDRNKIWIYIYTILDFFALLLLCFLH